MHHQAQCWSSRRHDQLAARCRPAASAYAARVRPPDGYRKSRKAWAPFLTAGDPVRDGVLRQGEAEESRTFKRGPEPRSFSPLLQPRGLPEWGLRDWTQHDTAHCTAGTTRAERPHCGEQGHTWRRPLCLEPWLDEHLVVDVACSTRLDATGRQGRLARACMYVARGVARE